MATFWIKQRCVRYQEIKVEAENEGAAWDAYDNEHRVFDVYEEHDESCEETGEIREGDRP